MANGIVKREISRRHSLRFVVAVNVETEWQRQRSCLIQLPIKSSRSGLKTHQINFAWITGIFIVSRSPTTTINVKDEWNNPGKVPTTPPSLTVLSNSGPASYPDIESFTFIILQTLAWLMAVTWNQSGPYSSFVFYRHPRRHRCASFTAPCCRPNLAPAAMTARRLISPTANAHAHWMKLISCLHRVATVRLSNLFSPHPQIHLMPSFMVIQELYNIPIRISQLRLARVGILLRMEVLCWRPTTYDERSLHPHT